MGTMRLLALGMELSGIAAIGAGIGLELAMHADIGYVLVTAGSCLIAIGGVIWGTFMRKGDGG